MRMHSMDLFGCQRLPGWFFLVRRRAWWRQGLWLRLASFPVAIKALRPLRLRPVGLAPLAHLPPNPCQLPPAFLRCAGLLAGRGSEPRSGRAVLPPVLPRLWPGS